MSRFWEIIINSQGKVRFHCFPFLLFFKVITPVYQFFSRRTLIAREKRCSRDWKAKVISIGNITVGGSGKTPLIVWLARRFIGQKKRVVIVHSGYGRATKEEIIIEYNSEKEYPAKTVGDEPVMMRIMVPEAGFAIGKNKKEIVIRADKELKPDIILIDDGFQRRDIAKDIDIAVLPSELYANTDTKMAKRRLRLFPMGILREPIQALKRADILFTVDYNEIDIKQLEAFTEREQLSQKVIQWKLSCSEIYRDGGNVSADELAGLKPFLFAGIGSFERMISMIEKMEIAIQGTYNFGDHYQYDKTDFESLKYLCKKVKANCYLTTAKDLVKLPHSELDKPVYCLGLDIYPVDEKTIEALFDGEADEKQL